LKILLVRLREIGDVVFTTPAIRAVRRRFPHAHLTYLVEPAAAPVVAGNPHIDHLIVLPRRRGLRGMLADFAFARELRRTRFDLAIDFHGGPRASLLTWLSGARVRVGYMVAARSWMYTRRVHRPRGLRPRHSVENQWDLLAALEVPPPTRDADPVEMPIDAVAAGAVGSRLAAAGCTAADRLIVIHVSAGNPFRRWPLASFGAVAAALASADSRHRIVLTAGPSEAAAARSVVGDARARLPAEARSRILDCGEFSLAEVRALADRAVLFVGGDSGPLHIAATTPVAIVGLYGPTLPARSAPWRGAGPHVAVEVGGLPCRPCDQRVCAPGDFRCLTWIQPHQIVDAASRASGQASG
jgi:ADP-heptose:LPS heptosyltransferase